MVKINITIPVYNEEECLRGKVETLLDFLKRSKFPYQYEIVIADNASTDNTSKIGKSLERRHSLVAYHHINKKGRGRALKEVWRKSDADVVSYMDVDLSTDLKYFRPLIDSIVISKHDLAIGNRLGKHSKVIGRSLRREILSRGYNILLRLLFFAPIRDAQCGFKAINKKSFLKLVDEIEDNGWFFDSEMILLTLRRRMKIAQIDVKWVDDSGTTVKIAKTAWDDLKGMVRVKKKFLKESFS